MSFVYIEEQQQVLLQSHMHTHTRTHKQSIYSTHFVIPKPKGWAFSSLRERQKWRRQWLAQFSVSAIALSIFPEQSKYSSPNGKENNTKRKKKVGLLFNGRVQGQRDGKNKFRFMAIFVFDFPIFFCSLCSTKQIGLKKFCVELPCQAVRLRSSQFIAVIRCIQLAHCIQHTLRLASILLAQTSHNYRHHPIQSFRNVNLPSKFNLLIFQGKYTNLFN